MMPCPVKVQGDSRELNPRRLLAFCRRRTALCHQTAIRHCTCGAPHAHSQGGAKLRSYHGGHFVLLDLAGAQTLLGDLAGARRLLGAGVGTPLTAKSLALAEGTLTKSLAAFPGVVWLILRGLDVIDNIPSLENLSSSSEGITSGPFAPAAAFAIVRRGGFV
jgi:hypothetical protein